MEGSIQRYVRRVPVAVEYTLSTSVCFRIEMSFPPVRILVESVEKKKGQSQKTAVADHRQYNLAHILQ